MRPRRAGAKMTAWPGSALRGIRVALLSMILPVSADAQVVALGASNTAGLGVARSEAYPARLEAMLRARGLDVRVLNAGISGDTTSDLLLRSRRDIPEGTRVVILSGREAMSNNPRQGVSPARGRADLAAIGHALQQHGIGVVPVITGGLPRRYRQADGAHLTPEGHRMIARELLPRVIAALKQRP